MQARDEQIERLRRLLGGPELERLRRRLRARYERGETGDEFTLTGLTTAERRGLEGLLGRSVRMASSMRVRLSELDAAISQAQLAVDLRSALELLDGPVQELRAQRDSQVRAWRGLFERIDSPRLRALISDPSGVALLKRLSASDPLRAEVLLTQARLVIERLPERGMPLARLAAEVLGDSHALDAGQPVATIVLRTCAVDSALAEDERTRDQWAKLGITVNELARPGLALNLIASDDSPGAALTRVAVAYGEPVYLSLRTLLREPPHWEVAGREIFVCENPEIVTMAADALGSTCPPLICTEGMPAAAQQTLLSQLIRRGGRLHYHGDFDWPGLVVGNLVVRIFEAAPWRFRTEDYLAACSTGGRELRADDRVEAGWDANLSAAMSQRAVAVHEEAMIEALLMDLRAHAATGTCAER